MSYPTPMQALGEGPRQSRRMDAALPLSSSMLKAEGSRPNPLNLDLSIISHYPTR
jgi:hypothetical protein